MAINFVIPQKMKLYSRSLPSIHASNEPQKKVPIKRIVRWKSDKWPIPEKSELRLLKLLRGVAPNRGMHWNNAFFGISFR